jgi:putative membrane protein
MMGGNPKREARNSMISVHRSGLVRSFCNVKALTLILGLGTVIALSPAFAAENENAEKEKLDKVSAPDSAFITKAAEGGMAEVELGKLAEKNGEREDVKNFGSQMVRDHGKANENLKSIAAKMNVPVPDKMSAKHQGAIDNLSKTTGAAFDTGYIARMVVEHEKTLLLFEGAQSQVSNEDLKKFIAETLPVVRSHLEMAKKMLSAK